MFNMIALFLNSNTSVNLFHVYLGMLFIVGSTIFFLRLRLYLLPRTHCWLALKG